jgi:hypothetical protein
MNPLDEMPKNNEILAKVIEEAKTPLLDSIDKMSQALVRAAAQALTMEVGDDEKQKAVIGPGKRFATTQEWVDKRIEAWMENKDFDWESATVSKTAYEWRDAEIKQRVASMFK